MTDNQDGEFAFWSLLEAATQLGRSGRTAEFAEALDNLERSIDPSSRFASSRLSILEHARLAFAGDERGKVLALDKQLSGTTGQWPRISLVTPTFNQGPFIEETIQSILGQGYPNLQYIIMDGGSRDGTVNVVERYRDRIDHFVSAKDEGQSDAINKGMAIADGEVLTWINSDDLLAPGALHTVGLEYALTRFDLFVGVCRVFNQTRENFSNLHTANLAHRLRVADLADLKGKWLRGYFFHQPEVFFSRRIWEAAGGFVRKDLHYSMDYELWTRFALHSPKIVKSAATVAEFRAHPAQKTVGPEVYLPELAVVASQVQESLRGKRASTASVAEPAHQSTDVRAHLRIVGVSDYGLKGGAGIAHANLLASLEAAGHQVIQLSCLSEWRPETTPYDLSSIVGSIAQIDPDLVFVGNLHNVSRGLDLLEWCASRFPTVFVAHDLWLITGRCAYTEGCTSYLSSCTTDCPSASSYPKLTNLRDITSIHERKRRLFEDSKSVLVLANSQWSAGRIASVLPRTVAEHRCGVVHLPIDTSVFHPHDKRACRVSLGIPLDRFVIVVGATHLNDSRKGFDIICAAVEELSRSGGLGRLHFVFFGAHMPDQHASVFGSYQSFDHIESRDHLARIYSAGDLFLGASREEALGQTYLEAMACGVPVVGVASGGIAEIVVQGVNGLLVDAPYASWGLSRAIRRMEALSTSEYVQMSESARRTVVSRHSFMAALGDFCELLERSGVAAELRYAPIVNAYSPSIASATISEVFTDLQIEAASSTDSQREHRLASDECVVLGAHGVEKTAEGPVIWLKEKSTICLPITWAWGRRFTITHHFRYIPDGMHGSPVTVHLNGLPLCEATLQDASVVFSFEMLSAGAGALLITLAFPRDVRLDDGRRVTALLGYTSIHA